MPIRPLLPLLLAACLLLSGCGGSNPETQAPAALSYATNPVTCTQGVAMVADVPSWTGGLPATITVSPALPQGLTLDGASGIIRGTPVTAQPLAAYAVTAANTAGATTCSVQITVRPLLTPSAELALPTSVHPGDHWMQASIPIQEGMTCHWTILPGTGTGTITSGQDTPVAAFAAGSEEGSFQVQAEVQNVLGQRAIAARTVIIRRGTWLVKNGGPGTERWKASTTLLPSGRVLVAGGGYEARAEIYDPASGTMTWTGAMQTPRTAHTATLLANGKVLVAGGDNAMPGTSAELYDPGTNTWTATGSLGSPRLGHCATLLPGGKVLVTGAAADALIHVPLPAAPPATSAESYDPGTGTWAPTAPSLYEHAGSTATLLPSGKVLVVGGAGTPATGPSSSKVELFDPATGAWTPGPSLNTGRQQHVATLLRNGQVLVSGGIAGFELAYTSQMNTYVPVLATGSERFDPATGAWSTEPGPAPSGYDLHALTLPDGRVLAAGSGSVWLYAPDLGSWTALTARGGNQPSLLLDGKVLVVGGGADAIARTFDPASGIWSSGNGPGGTDLQPMGQLPNGKVLAVSAHDTSCALYDPGSQSWAPTGGLLQRDYYSFSALLRNGSVFLVGPDSPEIYDPAAGTWSSLVATYWTQEIQSGTVLPSGKVLFKFEPNPGDYYGLGFATHFELFDPLTGAWSVTGSLAATRYDHSTTLLDSGKVMVAGGHAPNGQYRASAEAYDPALGTWAPMAGVMNIPRYDHTATLLLDGTVLVAGGATDTTFGITSAERYDPQRGTWTVTGDMPIGAWQHQATRLVDGRVIVNSNPSEIYNPTLGTWTLTPEKIPYRDYDTYLPLKDGTVISLGSNTITRIYCP